MKRLSTFLFFLLTLGGGMAQQAPAAEEKIESLRIAFLTRQLNLSTDEAQRFWPVYNSYTADAKKIQADLRTGKLGQLDFEEKMVELRKSYKGQFTKAVGAEKFEKFLKADREWRDMVRRELERRRAAMKQRRQGGDQ